MIPLYPLVEIFGSDDCDLGWATKALEDCFYLFDTGAIGAALVDHRISLMAKVLAKSFVDTAVLQPFRKHEIKCFSVPIDGAIQVHPLASNFEVGFIHSPRNSSGPLAFVRFNGNQR